MKIKEISFSEAFTLLKTAKGGVICKRFRDGKNIDNEVLNSWADYENYSNRGNILDYFKYFVMEEN